MVYDYQGNPIPVGNEFIDNTDIDYAFDSATNANYTVIRIYKTKIDGTKQYPFVREPASRSSTYDLVMSEPWHLAINGGIFNVSGGAVDGICVENGVVKHNSPATTHVGAMPLTIDENGDLYYADADADADDLVGDGIVSAVCGFCPIIIDYDAVDASFYNWISHYNDNAQRQIIGQFGNGDYAIVTCEGRGYQNSDGWTIPESITICQKLGLKFAYNLDGGGSTETMLEKKHINTIYDNTTGRLVPTFIVFNGLDEFSIPTE